MLLEAPVIRAADDVWPEGFGYERVLVKSIKNDGQKSFIGIKELR